MIDFLVGVYLITLVPKIVKRIEEINEGSANSVHQKSNGS